MLKPKHDFEANNILFIIWFHPLFANGKSLSEIHITLLPLNGRKICKKLKVFYWNKLFLLEQPAAGCLMNVDFKQKKI